MRRLLQVSTSGNYAWLPILAGETSTFQALSGRLTLDGSDRWIHLGSRGTYGAPRIHAELRDEGVRVSRKRVARLMKAAGLQGVSRRKHARTTIRQAGAHPAPDLVDRGFFADVPNEIWVANIT